MASTYLMSVPDPNSDLAHFDEYEGVSLDMELETEPATSTIAYALGQYVAGRSAAVRSRHVGGGRNTCEEARVTRRVSALVGLRSAGSVVVAQVVDLRALPDRGFFHCVPAQVFNVSADAAVMRAATSRSYTEDQPKGEHR
jgi:hypothetical protein